MKADLFLLRRVSLRALRRHPPRAALTLAGVAIGVSAFLAIRLANQGTLAGFRNTFDAVAGRAALEVTARGEPFDERLFARVRGVPGVRLAAPLLQVLAAAMPDSGASASQGARGERPKKSPQGPGPDSPQGVPLLVLGIDILSERAFRDYAFVESRPAREDTEEALRRLLAPDVLFLTDRFAARHGLKVGDALLVEGPAGPRRLAVRGLLRSAGSGRASPASALDGSVALMDIAAAQGAFGRIGQLDRVDVLPEAGEDLDALAERIRAVLPGDLTVARPARRSRQSERLLAAFQLNLTVLSYIAFLVGIFIIYNAMSITVVRRRQEWGVLRSLGVSSRRVGLLVLAEAALLGLAGAAVGILLGAVLGRGALEAVSRTVGSLFVPVGATEVRLTRAEVLLGLGAGTASALLSSLVPAWAAARMSVRESIARGGVTAVRHMRTGLTAALGLALLAASAVLTRPGPVRGVPLFGYLAALCVILGTSLLAPWAIRLFTAGCRLARARTRRAEAVLVDLTRSSGKNSVAVASLAVAVAMLVSVSVMVASFRATLETWIGDSLRADLYVSPAVRFIGNQTAVLPQDAPEKAARTEGVLAVDALRARRITFREWPILLRAGDLQVVRDHGGLTFLGGERRAVLNRAAKNGEALVSEVFSNRFGLGRGDRFILPTAGGPREFRIAGVLYDYSTEGGLVVMDREVYRRLWKDDRVSTLAVYLKPGADPERAKDALASALGPRSGAAVFENRRLRRHVLQVFDQTFAITYALEGIALVVAVLGVLKALLTNVLERTREIGLLRAIGFDRGQVFRWVVGEAAAMAFLANVLGFLAGGVLAWILIFVVNKQSFGWTIEPHWPPGWVAGYFVLTLVAAAGAAAWPARVAAGVEVGEAIRFE